MTGQSQKSKRKNLFGFERPCSYPRFVLFGNFLENASDAVRRATHTHARVASRTPTNLPSFPQSLADPYLNLPHRRLPPPTPAHGTNAKMAATRLSLNTASFAPSRVARPAGRCVPSKSPPSRIPRSFASHRAFWRVRRGASASTRRAATRELPRTSRGRSQPRRCVETLDLFCPRC